MQIFAHLICVWTASLDVHCRDAALCDTKPKTHSLGADEEALLKADPVHLVSELNRDELQHRVRAARVACAVWLLPALRLLCGSSGPGWRSTHTTTTAQASRPSST
jgi:hypothetical protein